MASIRKIYIDSRFGIGPPNDFTVELPLQVTTTKEQGLVLGQFSIPNVFGSVIAGYNDRLYWRVDGVNAPNTIQTGVNDRFYWGWDDGQQNWVITTLPAGTYTAEQMATLLAVRINTVIPNLVATAGPPQYDAPVIQWDSNHPRALPPLASGHHRPRVAAGRVARGRVQRPGQQKRRVHPQRNATVAARLDRRHLGAQRLHRLQRLQHHRSWHLHRSRLRDAAAEHAELRGDDHRQHAHLHLHPGRGRREDPGQ